MRYINPRFTYLLTYGRTDRVGLGTRIQRHLANDRRTKTNFKVSRRRLEVFFFFFSTGVFNGDVMLRLLVARKHKLP